MYTWYKIAKLKPTLNLNWEIINCILLIYSVIKFTTILSGYISRPPEVDKMYMPSTKPLVAV